MVQEVLAKGLLPFVATSTILGALAFENAGVIPG